MMFVIQNMQINPFFLLNKNMKELTTIRSKLSCPGGKLAPDVKHSWQFPLQAACRQPVEKVRGIQKSIKESNMY